MPNYCEEKKPSIDQATAAQLTTAFDTFRTEIGSGHHTIFLNKNTPDYLKIGRANLEAILNDDNVSGIGIAFGLKKIAPASRSYLMTTIVAPLVPIDPPSTNPQKPGQCKIEINSTLAFDDLGEGGFLTKSYAGLHKHLAIEEIKTLVDSNPEIKSFLKFIFDNLGDFKDII